MAKKKDASLRYSLKKSITTMAGAIAGLRAIFAHDSPLWQGDASVSQLMAVAMLGVLLLLLLSAVILGSITPSEPQREKKTI
jgi:hypothetical protein